MSTIIIHTGLLAYANLEQYNTKTGIATGATKTNSISDPDYIAPAASSQCPTYYTRYIGDAYSCEVAPSAGFTIGFSLGFDS